jgi:hypothetical protein
MSAEHNTKRKVMHFIFLQMALLQEISRVVTRYTKLMFFYQRNRIINLFTLHPLKNLTIQKKVQQK